MVGQEELDVGALVDDGHDAALARAELQRGLVLVRGAEPFEPRRGHSELVDEVALGEGAHLEADGLVAGDQAVDAPDRGRELLHGEDGGQAGGVAGLYDQDHEEPDDDHETPQRAPGVLSCKKHKMQSDSFEFVREGFHLGSYAEM